MISPDYITLIENTISKDEDGNPSSSQNSISVYGYFDFSIDSLKQNKDAENIKLKAKIFITKQEEINKVVFVPDTISYDSKEYKVLNFESGLKHIEIHV